MPSVTVNISKLGRPTPFAWVKHIVLSVLSYVKQRLVTLRNCFSSLLIRRGPGAISDDCRVLAINLQALGDTTISLDAFRLLQIWANEDSRRKVTFAVRRDLKGWVESRIYGSSVVGTGPELDELRSRADGFDVLIDFDSSSKQSGYLVQRMYSFKKRYGFRSKGKKWWYDEGPGWGEVSAATKCGSCTKVGSLYLQLAKRFVGDNACMSAVRVTSSERGFKRIVVHPGASHPGNRWFGYEELICDMAKWYDGTILFVEQAGSGFEKPIRHQLIGKLPNVECRSTDTVIDLSALIGSAELLICNNSGPLHVAVELGVATLSIAGPSPDIWFPIYSDRKPNLHHVIISDVHCCGCDTPSRCPYQLHCFKGISVRMVSDYAKVIVGTGSPA